MKSTLKSHGALVALVAMVIAAQPAWAGFQVPGLRCALAETGGSAGRGRFSTPSAALVSMPGTTTKLCVLDIVCNTDGGDRQQTSAVCRARDNGACPGVAECIGDTSVLLETARIESAPQRQPTRSLASEPTESSRLPANDTTAPEEPQNSL